MPMLHSGSNFQHIALADDLGGFSLLLIVTHTTSDQNDHAAVRMPIAPRSRRKRHVVGLWEMIDILIGNHWG